MRILLVAFGFAGITSAVAQNRVKNDSTPVVQVVGRIQVSNMGFAPVPAFSFNSPIVIGLLSVKKKRLSFEPDMAVGLNGKPWMINNWFRLSLPQRNAWRANVGLNPSLFFKNEQTDSDKEIVHAHRNLTGEIAAERHFSKWAFRLAYQRIKAFDEGTLSGNFFDVSCPLIVARWRERLSVHVKPQVFYFNFDGNVDGLFTSCTVTVKHLRFPVSFYTQGVLPLWTNFPDNGFKWNFGVFVTFK